MNLVLVGGTREPVKMLQYMRLLRESSDDGEELLKTVFKGRGVRTQIAFTDLRFVSSMFLVQGCTGFIQEHLQKSWGGSFLVRPPAPKEEVHDIVWHISWKHLFDGCYTELARAALEGKPKGPYAQIDFKLANAAATLLFNCDVGVRALLEDYTLFRQDAMATQDRCVGCRHFTTRESDIGRCRHHALLTGEERACQRFQSAPSGGAR